MIEAYEQEANFREAIKRTENADEPILTPKETHPYAAHGPNKRCLKPQTGILGLSGPFANS